MRSGLPTAPALLALLACPAWAADVPYGPPPAPGPVASLQRSQPFVSELRLGSFAHDPWSPEGGAADLNAELLFAKPYLPRDPFWAPFIPRPHVGTTISFDGKTSQVYAGLTWTYDLTSRLFVEGSFGGSANDGKTGRFIPADRNALGCNVMFRESASVGFRFTSSVSLMGTVDHTSNAGLCRANRGLTNYGARLGYQF